MLSLEAAVLNTFLQLQTIISAQLQTMSTRETVKKRKKKARRKLQLRSKHRRHAYKTKRKPIGLKSAQDTSELIINNNTTVTTIDENTQTTLSTKSTPISSKTSTSQLSTNGSSKSPSKKLFKKNRRKKISIGLNFAQKKRQQNARRDRILHVKNVNKMHLLALYHAPGYGHRHHHHHHQPTHHTHYIQYYPILWLFRSDWLVHIHVV